MKVYNLHTLCCPEPLYYMQSDNSDKYQFGLRALYFWDHFIHNKIFITHLQLNIFLVCLIFNICFCLCYIRHNFMTSSKARVGKESRVV